MGNSTYKLRNLTIFFILYIQFNIYKMVVLFSR